MSGYLLLRNNKESGPYTLDEIKGMSLKPLDLLWVVGKSAAWRYPGEIPEFRSFAPPVPEQLINATNNKSDSDFLSDKFTVSKKDESSGSRVSDNNSQQTVPARSVYVNLPAEKKTTLRAPSLILFDEESFPSIRQESSGNYTDLYTKKPSRSVRFSSRVLWISTIILLFGAGILTGLFISDRRNFFSTDENHPQTGINVQPSVVTIKKENPSDLSGTDGQGKTNPADSLKSIKSISRKSTAANGKKTNPGDSKKDSLNNLAQSGSSQNLNDSLKQNAISDTEILYQKIKKHPENYINLVTGRYSKGLLGGISSFSVSITNNSPVTMDLVVINVDYIQNNQKVFKTESLSLNDLVPGETVTLKAPKSPRGVKVATRIQVVNSRQLDLSFSH